MSDRVGVSHSVIVSGLDLLPSLPPLEHRMDRLIDSRHKDRDVVALSGFLLQKHTPPPPQSVRWLQCHTPASATAWSSESCSTYYSLLG